MSPESVSVREEGEGHSMLMGWKQKTHSGKSGARITVALELTNWRNWSSGFVVFLFICLTFFFFFFFGGGGGVMYIFVLFDLKEKVG